MEKSMSSVKCAQCGLVNFATAEVCKRCGNAFVKDEPQIEQPAPEQQQAVQPEAQAVQTSNLMPCPDCAHLCSRMAESCPNCGRILRQLEKPVKSILRPIIVVGVFAVLCMFAIGVYLLMQRQVAVQAAVQSGNPANAGVSSGNRDAARAALNAIGEVQSVTSVGTNYMQYSATLQSAKIKFDAAMRDYKPRDAAELEIGRQLKETLYNYVDARDAWAEFVKDGDSYGFISEENSVVKSMATKYGYSSSKGEFFNGTVLDSIWSKASKTFNAVSERLK